LGVPSRSGNANAESIVVRRTFSDGFGDTRTVTKRAFDNGFVHCRSVSVRKSDGFGDSAARTVRRCGSDF
jgi:hypothetical protein